MNPNPKTKLFVEEEEESTGGAPASERSAVVPVPLEGKLPTVLVVVLLELAGEPGNNGREVPAAAVGESPGDCVGIRGREEEGSGVEEEEEGERAGTMLRGCIGKTEEGEGAFRVGIEFGSGVTGAAFAVGITFTSSFIPCVQCPGIPQMKSSERNNGVSISERYKRFNRLTAIELRFGDFNDVVECRRLDGGPRWCSVRGGAEAGQAKGESGAEASQVKQASRDGLALRVQVLVFDERFLLSLVGPKPEAVARGKGGTSLCSTVLRHWREDDLQEKPPLRFSETERDSLMLFGLVFGRCYVAVVYTRLVASYSQCRLSDRSGSDVIPSRGLAKSRMELSPQPAFQSGKTAAVSLRSS
ncbi:hypothetical protein Bca4012_082173 [Brassica carinata]